jgi:RNA polymerase sigma-70 factor (ECF subfamily)
MKCNETNYIERLKKGKEDALEFIVDNYLGLVKAAVYKVLSPLETYGIIDECINDIFLSVWNNANKFSGKDSDFKKWIYKIAKFKAIDYYRKQIKNLDTSIEDKEICADYTVEDEIIIEEDMNELIKLINILEPIDKDIFAMKFFLGVKSDDIAAKLGLTRAAIDNRIYRGKKKLCKEVDRLKLEVL